jgi:hypothetical protein
MTPLLNPQKTRASRANDRPTLLLNRCQCLGLQVCKTYQTAKCDNNQNLKCCLSPAKTANFVTLTHALH